MCGIVGYAGKKQAAPILLNGLSKLEYRGYDSSGIAVLNDSHINMVKAKGRLKELENKTDNGKLLNGVIGIGHTRWATHGEPNDINSHPHVSNSGQFAVVHNGIIENYLELKDFLTNRNFVFLSDTDTEVIALLIEHYYDGDMLETIRKVTNKLKGSYALGILCSATPDLFYAVRKDSPLVIGLGEEENFIASDMPALLQHTKKFILLDDNEIATVTKWQVRIHNHNKELVKKEPFTAEWDVTAAEKDGFPHFMLKEIYEQPKAIEKTITSRIDGEKIKLDNIKLTAAQIGKINKINIVGCGSAYHAGIVGKYFIESVAKIPVEVDLASEFRYRNPLVDANTLTIAISQSGETADTLAAIRESKSKGSRILSIVNVVGSSIARESDDVLYTLAGPEIAVATTKGYTTQVAALYLLGLFFANEKSAIDKNNYTSLLSELKNLHLKVEDVIKNSTQHIQYISSLIFSNEDAYFIGRGLDYAASLEGSLKLKEISYIHAEAYAAGELKHGTISLIENGTLLIAVATNPALSEKTLSNVKEVKTRGGTIVSLVPKTDQTFDKESDYMIYLPATDPLFSPVTTATALQLLGYYVAAAKGLDIDKPRNLAKSVTVE